MTRLELLHTILDNDELLSRNDAFMLLAGRLPEGNAAVSAAWEALAQALLANDAIAY